MAETTNTGGINAGNYEQRLTELRTYGNSFKAQDAKDIVGSVVQLLQTAWNIEQHQGTAAMRANANSPEARSTR